MRRKDKRRKDKTTSISYERLGTKNFISPEKQVFCTSCGSELNYETTLTISVQAMFSIGL